MKKLVVILAALLLVPFSAFGLEMLQDDAMGDVTGQAGVHIAVDDVQMYLQIDKMAYVDNDGYLSVEWTGTIPTNVIETGDGAEIAMEKFEMDVITVNALVSLDTATGQFVSPGRLGIHTVVNATGAAHSASVMDNYNLGTYLPDALTIDVVDYLPAISMATAYKLPKVAAGAAATGGTLSVDAASTDIAGVRIGFPTVEIFINEITVESVTVTAADTTGVANRAGNGPIGNSFGGFYLQNVTFDVLGGWMEIAPH
jgi:hypothetical protein